MYECVHPRIHYINILQSVHIMKKNLITFSILFIFFLMLAFPAVTKGAANDGLNLWIFTVLPALLPYTIISSILMQLGAFSTPCQFISRFVKHKIPEHKIFTVICGCLCGCPIGAKVAADSYKKGLLTKDTSEFLMCTCNNLSPSFLINYVFVEVYAPFIELTISQKWLIYFIITGSSFFGSLITHILFIKKHAKTSFISPSKPIPTDISMQKKPALGAVLEDCILSAFEIQAKIGGYIILFTIITNLFLHTLCLSDIQAAIFGSLLEVTSGLGLFQNYSHNISLNQCLITLIPAIVTSLVAFGGICTIFQTKTALSSSGLSLKKYVISKLITGCLAFGCTILLL